MTAGDVDDESEGLDGDPYAVGKMEAKLPGPEVWEAADRTRPFHLAGAAPFALQFVELDEVLDRGGHRPLRCRLEFADGEPAGEWVVKPPISLGDAESREELSVLAELAGAEVCAWAGMPTPAIGLLTMPDPIHPAHLRELDSITQQQLKVNAGRVAFCSRFLEDAVEWTPKRHRQGQRGRKLARAYGPGLMLVDAFMLHDDRTPGKPNCLETAGRIVPIDHGSAFVGMDKQGADVADYVAPSKLAASWNHHVFRHPVRKGRKELRKPHAVAKLTAIGDGDVRALGERWPEALRIPKTRSGREIVSEMLEFLVRRPAHSSAIWQLLVQFLGKSDG